MANRKVLINRHTSTSGAPIASEMFKGEIAVAHKTGEEILWTKNNDNEMVPFISCAQTMTMINNAISDADVTYDVEAANGDAHIEVVSGGTEKAKVFTVSSKDVQSKDAFDAYSAATDATIKNNYNTLSGAIDDVLAIITTAITGDNIISVTPATSGAGSYALAHKTATAVTGFNKLETDAYGHVTAATAVAASDIKNLGFEDSAWTEEKIASAITSLDSSISASSAGKYFTALAIENGKLVAKEEASIPVLEVESAGTGNVVASITVADHKITYQTASVATSEGIAALSASVINLSAVTGEFSGATDSRINDLSGYTEAVDDKVEKLSAATISISGFAHGEIAELSAATSAVSVDVENLSAATLNLSAVTLTGVSLNSTPLTVTGHVVSIPVTVSGDGIANATNSGSVADAKAVKEYVENLISSAVEYKGATGATPSNPAKGDLYIASSDFVVEGSKSAETGDFIIYDGTKWDVIEKNLDGAITGNLTQDTVTLGDSTNSVRSLANGANGTVLTIVNGVPAWANDPELTVVSAGTGNVISNITVSDHEITFTKGVTAADDADLQALSGVVREFSATTDAKFIELSAYTKDVDDKVKALSAGTIQLSADTVAYVDAQIDDVYASAVSYADSAITYAIEGLDSVGSASTTGHYLTSVTITDGKISAVGEVAVPAAVAITATTGAAVDTPSAVLTGVTADGTDNHNLTFGMSNKVFSAASSDSALTAVHADAASKVDSALTINIIDSAGTTASTVFDGSANQTINITNTDTATTEAGHYAPATAASAFTAPAGSFLSGVSVDSKNHVLEVAYADKINSATTSESADTAAVADKVANALSISGYSDSSASSLDTAISYDGSAAQALTFGTVGNAGLNSMSMTSAGLVDVEVIDCGEY